MSSILTNTSAMVALQTLKGINASLTKTQDEIATGKSVASAKDNAAVWAISKVMESDVKGFKAISDSLSLGESSVAVARQASETVSDLLTEIKGKVVAAQESNVDRAKIQTDINALRDQITSVVGAAQFNGLNLVQGTEAVDILSSLDRANDGTVAASNISVERHDLTTSTGSMGSGTDLSANATLSAAAATNTGNSATITLAADADVSGDTFEITVGGATLSFAAGDITGDQDAAASAISGAINALGLVGVSASASTNVVTLTSTRAFEDVAIAGTKNGGATDITLSAAEISERAETLTFSASANVKEGDGYQMSVGGTAYTYVAGKGETFEDVARGLKAAVDGGKIADVTTQVAQNDSGQWTLKVDNNSGSSVALARSAAEGGTASGGLFGLGGIDVTTDAGADAALGTIETLIDNAIDASAAFGSVEGRIGTQNDFIGKLTDALKTGIGSMVDADMEAASARLQALQVQQQLGTQALSIANQAPQNILSLFR
ncbi:MULTISPECIES: flagellin [Actibacterium]|uniref:Flagellin n=1 Tax=Actibacterium naphthalenivorans TaxID=1614693 RepID=A0A840C7R4_9RHOB|nr:MULTISPECIES: flagellin [Actibacterium]ALG88986.1 flagellin [Actibacterium sp. EMB200-NS6]MBB4021465.1 flagellin [Actibacterium naphthalenivorans]